MRTSPLAFLPPSLPKAVLIKTFSMSESPYGGLVEGHSGSLLSGGDTYSARLCNLAITLSSVRGIVGGVIAMSSVRGIVGGVIAMLNQNRCHWTPPKWFSSRAVSPLVSPANYLMSHVDLWWYGCDAEPTLDAARYMDDGASSVGALLQKLGQQRKTHQKKHVFSWFDFSGKLCKQHLSNFLVYLMNIFCWASNFLCILSYQFYWPWPNFKVTGVISEQVSQNTICQ